jgi:hypothetical protein
LVEVTDISNRTSSATHTITRSQQVPTTLTVAAASGTYGGSTTLSATLTSGSAGVAGKTVSFTLGGQTADAVTNAAGVATVANFSIAGQNAGSHLGAISASFAGDPDNVASSGTGDLTVTKATQTIVFDVLANRTFGQAAFGVTATAPGGPVSFASAAGSVGCSVSGSTVTITGATGAGESCTIVASQGGSANYSAAPDVSRSFAIAKATQAITFASLPNHTYGDGPFTIAATASSGLPVGFTATGSCTVLGSTVTLTGANACGVTAAQAGNSNFAQAPNVTQTFYILHSWSNLLQPINVDGTSIFKLGSTIPVKFRLAGTSAGLLIDARILVAKISSGVVGNELEAVATNAPDGGNAFRYDATSDQYIFNWGTKGLHEGTWQIRVDLQDGAAPRTVMVSLKK